MENGDRLPRGSKKFWTTLPGILTGVAALLTAVTGLAALLLTGPLAKAQPQRPAVEANASASPRGGDPSERLEPPGALIGGVRGDVLKQGRLDMNAGDWAELASGTVGSGSTSFDYLVRFIDYGTREAPTLYSAKFARSEPSPGFDACAALLARRQDAELDVSPSPSGAEIGPGDWFCLKDNSHQMASVKIENASLDPPAVSLSYVLWRLD